MRGLSVRYYNKKEKKRNFFFPEVYIIFIKEDSAEREQKIMSKYVLDRKIWSLNPEPLKHHLCVVHGQTDRVRRYKI